MNKLTKIQENEVLIGIARKEAERIAKWLALDTWSVATAPGGTRLIYARAGTDEGFFIIDVRRCSR